MKSLMEQKVGVGLGIAFICLFSAIYLSIFYYAVDSELQKFGNDYYRLYVKK